MTMITTVLTAIVVFFGRLFGKTTKTEAQKVHEFIDTEIAMVSNEIVLDRMHAMVDQLVSENPNLTAKEIAIMLLQFVNKETNLNQNCSARYTYYKAGGFIRRYLVTVVNHDTKDIQKYRTYFKKNVSPQYVQKKYGIFVPSVNESLIDMQFMVRPVKMKKLQKRRYSRNCVCTG